MRGSRPRRDATVSAALVACAAFILGEGDVKLGRLAAGISLEPERFRGARRA